MPRSSGPHRRPRASEKRRRIDATAHSPEPVDPSSDPRVMEWAAAQGRQWFTELLSRLSEAERSLVASALDSIGERAEAEGYGRHDATEPMRRFLWRLQRIAPLLVGFNQDVARAVVRDLGGTHEIAQLVAPRLRWGLSHAGKRLRYWKMRGDPRKESLREAHRLLKHAVVILRPYLRPKRPWPKTPQAQALVATLLAAKVNPWRAYRLTAELLNAWYADDTAPPRYGPDEIRRLWRLTRRP
jgi:hypothetical protein